MFALPPLWPLGEAIAYVAGWVCGALLIVLGLVLVVGALSPRRRG